jgi:hypothetical protein
MSGDPIKIDRILGEYRKQVLRWNDQINLVSRKGTAHKLDGLIQQCRDSWDRLVDPGVSDLGESTRIWYFDLGSGAGLPGIVWHVRMATADLSVRTLLVEPREKRAWFLERVAHQVGGESPHVAVNRWGDEGIDSLAEEFPESRPSHVLISLKALHLPDLAVLEGLAPFLETTEDSTTAPEGEISLLIARFYPPDQIWSEDLAGELDILPRGQVRSAAETYQFHSEGGSVLQPATLPGASLVLSRYKILVR